MRTSRGQNLGASPLHSSIAGALKGKQKHAREGFDFAVPATFANGFFLGQGSAGGIQDAGTSKAETCRPLFFGRRAPMDDPRSARDDATGNVRVPRQSRRLTTYSWRRLAPTVAQLLGCRPEEMAALGDWQNKSEQPEVGAMAFHYSSAKYAASVKVKSLIWGATAKLASNLLWEAIPQAEQMQPELMA